MIKKFFATVLTKLNSSALIVLNSFFLWVFFSVNNLHFDSPGDMVESYAWGISWTLGNNKHPPLFGWITAAWFGVFPTTNWAYYLMVAISLLIASFFLMQSMHQVLHKNKAFVALALTIVVLPLGLDHGYKYNANLAQLPFLTGYMWALLGCLNDKNWSKCVAAGVMAGAAILCKYSAILILCPITLVVMIHLRAKLTRVIPQLLLIFFVFLAVIGPHFYWEIQHHWPSMHYLNERSRIAGWNWLVSSVQSLYDILKFGVGTLLLLTIALSLPRPIYAFSQAYQNQARLGMTVFVLCVLCTFFGAYEQQFKPDPSWFIVSSIFLGWALTDILPKDLDWDELKSRITFLILVYFILIALDIFYIKISRPSSLVLYDELPQIFARDVTRLYHDTYHKPIDYTGGSHPLAYDLTFYSPDHPYGFYELDLEGSTWIDKNRFRSSSKVIVCTKEKHFSPKDPKCSEEALTLLGPPDTQKILKYQGYDPNSKSERYVEYDVLMYR